jgi:hypothetical protein|uniref:Uncharacterized protein n=2 Tax=Picea TaxID=3328 RepID=A0A117NGP5_PICGL|nr:hypothetical protein ABT39_MTgene6126 [Picea glauca]QHR92576.1 hypothetical protein Q903MT_gene6622 [Picea sitchensis]
MNLPNRCGDSVDVTISNEPTRVNSASGCEQDDVVSPKRMRASMIGSVKTHRIKLIGSSGHQTHRIGSSNS